MMEAICKRGAEGRKDRMQMRTEASAKTPREWGLYPETGGSQLTGKVGGIKESSLDETLKALFPHPVHTCHVSSVPSYVLPPSSFS